MHTNATSVFSFQGGGEAVLMKERLVTCMISASCIGMQEAMNKSRRRIPTIIFHHYTMLMLLESVSGPYKELALGGLILVHNRVCVLC